MQIRMKDKIQVDYSTSGDWRQMMQEIAGTVIDVETDYLFRGQYNTAPIKGVSASGLRIMDKDVAEVIDDARIGLQKCYYCGSTSPVSADVCPKCQHDKTHLEPFEQEKFAEWKRWADQKRRDDKVLDQLKKFEDMGTSGGGNFMIVDTIGDPHPYCIGSRHLKYNDSIYLGAEQIRTMESKHNVSCGVRGCDLSYDEHKQGLLVGCKEEMVIDEKNNAELHEYLLELKESGKIEKYTGFAFIKYNVWERGVRKNV